MRNGANANDNVRGAGIKALIGLMVSSEIKRQGNKADKEDDAVARAFNEVNRKIEVREKIVRVGETMAKVRGKNSVKGMPTFSKEKSVNIQKAQMKKGKGLEKSDHKQAIMSEDREIAK